MLIRRAEVWNQGIADVRIDNGVVTAVGALEPQGDEAVHEARGGALLPGLHDHHIHLAALAARRTSVVCGPPDVLDQAGLALVLARPGTGWIRGIGFHESVTGGHLPDRAMLDSFVAERPLRLQHRGGRMWLLNSMALDALLASASPPTGLEREGRGFTGRLFEEDAWLQQALGSQPPDLHDIGQELAARGVTGATDMSPRNDAVMAAHFAGQAAQGMLPQRLVLAGTRALAEAPQDGWALGPLKLHLHEAALPDFDEAAALIASGHAQARAVAVHCVSEVELVFTLALLEHCGTLPGDRIEHASIASPDLVARMAKLGLQACVQPHFIFERGDRYLRDVELRHQPDLYRLQSLLDAGIGLAGGSDAPYGNANPWHAMAAAVERRTSGGAVIGGGEALAPEQALALYLADPLDLTRQRCVSPGTPADLCLLDRDWAAARGCLADVNIAATWISGQLVHQSIDQPPLERLSRADPPA